MGLKCDTLKYLSKGSKDNQHMTVDASKIRVVMVSQFYPLSNAIHCGGSSATLNLCRALSARQDVDLTVIRPLASREECGACEQQYGFTVVPLRYWMRWCKLFGLFVIPLIQCCLFIRKLKPDVIHIHDSSLLACLFPKRSVLTLHGLVEIDQRLNGKGFTNWIRVCFLRLAFGVTRNLVHHIIAVSPYVCSVLSPSSKRRVWMVPNVVDRLFFSSAGIRTTAPNVRRMVTVAEISPLKNTRVLIEAVQRLRGRLAGHPVCLDIIGGGEDSPYGRECREYVRRQSLESVVTFHGILGALQIREKLRQASAFVLCSLQENAPMAIAEAMAVGVPIVASRVGGIPWMLEEGESGILVDSPSEAEDVSACIERILVPEVNEKFRSASLRRSRIFAEQYVTERIVGAYREIALENHR